MNQGTVDAALDQWQSELEAHFSALAQERKKSDLPVFAIEHCFNQETIGFIASGLKKKVQQWQSLGRHWLLWVVYAAELGYDYDGEEYWPSFERRTPHWREDVDRRRQLRQWFVRFHKTYGGLRPTGPWAAQFSIISWPITHALLPKDLQNQLARLLYEQRYVVARFVDAPAKQVGHLLSTSAYASSSRLSNFLEQEELAGRLVLSLLGSQEQEGLSVQKVTLDRVIADLGAARQARLWLDEARSIAERARAKLAARRSGRSSNGRDESQHEQELQRAESRGIRPRVSLIRESLDSWAPVIEMPSFAGVAAIDPSYASFLRTSRCMVAGTGIWNARGWLLYGSQRKRLLDWPEVAKPLLRFEQWNQGLFHLLVAECRLSKGPTWLFRTASDGTAPEVISRSVRLESEYVLLHTVDLPQSPLLTPTHLACNGVSATALRMPQAATEIPPRMLENLGLHLERTVRVWPAGISPVAWDGEGELEWFSSDELCLGMQSDSASGTYTVTINGRGGPGPFRLEPNRPSFLALGKLPIGLHTLVFSAVHDSDGPRVARAGLSVSIAVRQRRRWVPGTSGHSGLIVTTEPHQPGLDELLSGRVRVSVAGPEGRVVSVSVDFLDASGSVLSTEPMGELQLPCTADIWRNLVDARGRRDIDPTNSIRASAGRLRVESDGLGATVIPLSHAVSPIRWTAEGVRTPMLRLVNDTGHEDDVSIQCASFREPTTGVKMAVPDSSVPLQPTGHGGLFIATSGVQTAAIVVSVPSRGGLQELADRPNLEKPLTSGTEVEKLLKWVRAWSSARLVGPLAAQRRSITLRAMEDQLFQTMCWPEWLRAEQAFREERGTPPQARERLENAVHHMPFAVSLSRAAGGLLTTSVHESTQNFLGIAIRFHVCGNEAHCEAALRLAATPERFVEWAGPRTVQLLDALVDLQPLLRGARLLVLLGGAEAHQLFYGWSE